MGIELDEHNAKAIAALAASMRDIGVNDLVIKHVYTYCNDEGNARLSVDKVRMNDGSMVASSDIDSHPLFSKEVSVLAREYKLLPDNKGWGWALDEKRMPLSKAIKLAMQSLSDDECFTERGSHSHDEEYDDEGGYRHIDIYSGKVALKVSTGMVIDLNDDETPRHSYPRSRMRW